jgi:tetratricopeptide (TPR) repeat protein
VDRLWSDLVETNPPQREKAKTKWEKVVSDKLRQHPRPSILRHFYPARLFFQMGNYESSRVHLENALQEADRIKDYTGGLYILAHMAQVFYRLGEYDFARGLGEKMLSTMDDSTQASNLAFMLYEVMGDVAEAQGDLKTAAEYFEKALKNAQRRKDPHAIHTATQKRDVVTIRMGRLQKGTDPFTTELENARQNGNKQIEGVLLGRMGCVYKDRGLHSQAITYLEKALVIAQKLGDRQNEGEWLGNLGSVYQNIGDHQKALELYKKAKEIAEMIGDKENVGTWLSNMGISYKETGNYKQATDCYERAIKISQHLGDKRGLGIALNNLGNLYRVSGKRERARQIVLEAIDLAVEIGDMNAAARRKRLLQAIEE